MEAEFVSTSKAAGSIALEGYAVLPLLERFTEGLTSKSRSDSNPTNLLSNYAHAQYVI